jgi:hypothetical protein
MKWIGAGDDRIKHDIQVMDIERLIEELSQWEGAETEDGQRDLRYLTKRKLFLENGVLVNPENPQKVMADFFVKVID